MGKVVITIETDNAAFEEGREFELRRILGRARLEDNEKLYDINGNPVGKVEVV